MEAFAGVTLQGTEYEQELSWRAFARLEALAGANGEWLFLPSQVLQEPEVIMQNCLLLRQYAKARRDVTR